MQGLHLTADLFDCTGDRAYMTDADTLAALCREQTLASGLTLVAEKWHTFPDYQGQPGGVTGMLLLAESHLAVHTWPELNAVTLDVYVCNFEADNTDKPQRLVDALQAAFAPGRAQQTRLWRGDIDGPAPVHVDTSDGKGLMLWEPVNDNSLYGFRFRERLVDMHTGLQHLEVLESDDLGKTLRLDGCMMTAEKEEFFYHEALIHPATMAHPQPRRALILGGGDGGALEELLKHPLESVTLVDLDGKVIEVAREHLQSIHKGAFDDPRVTVNVGDGAKFVAETDDRFDLVFLDLTDPETPAGPLYTQAFFETCKRILNPGGAVVLHIGAPFYEPKQVKTMTDILQSVFREVHAYGLHIPLYGAYWGLTVASDTLDPTLVTADDIAQRLQARDIQDLQYYNTGIHAALFALPNYYQKLVDKPL